MASAHISARVMSNMTDNEDFASLFNEFEKDHANTVQKEPKTGDKVAGTVVSIDSDYIFIDLGAKTEGR